jgi:hypothetical protein
MPLVGTIVPGEAVAPLAVAAPEVFSGAGAAPLAVYTPEEYPPVGAAAVGLFQFVAGAAAPEEDDEAPYGGVAAP